MNKFCGGHSGSDTPGSIPNPEAKPASADGTALEGVWESKTPPQLNMMVCGVYAGTKSTGIHPTNLYTLTFLERYPRPYPGSCLVFVYMGVE